MRLPAGPAARHLWRATACAFRHWSGDNCSNTAAALAFFCAFSLAPLLVILLTISGVFIGERSAYRQIETQVAALFGPAAARTLLGAVYSVQHIHRTWPALISIVALLIGATTVLAALQQALERIWQSGTVVTGVVTGVYGWVRTRVLSFCFILTLGFLLLVSLTISTALASIRAQIAASHRALVGTIGLLDIAFSLASVSVLFSLLYRYMPVRRLPWRPVIIGGVLTAALFNAGHWLIGLYLARSTEPSVYGAASSFVALLLWLYYSALIVLFGAELTACLGGARNGEPPPAK